MSVSVGGTEDMWEKMMYAKPQKGGLKPRQRGSGLRIRVRDWSLIVYKILELILNMWFTNVQEKNIVMDKNIVMWMRTTVSGMERCSINTE